MSTRAQDPLVGSVLELQAGPIAHGGHVVARHEGRVIFVRHALPGEQVLAKVISGKEGDSYLRAEAVQVIQAAPGRVQPPCRYSGPGGCGGCDFQHVDLPTQRRLKGEVVSEQLRRLAGLDLQVNVEPVPGDRNGLGWRTRMQFAVQPDGTPGLRLHRSTTVQPLQECLIASAPIQESGVLQRTWPEVDAVEVAHSSTGQLSVLPHPRVREQSRGRGRSPKRTGRATRERSSKDVPVLTETVEVSGAEELRLQVAGDGFWQVHPGAAATLVAAVLDGLRPAAGERALDLYCGVGLFAASLRAPLGREGSVIAVEADRQATRHAEDNLSGGHGAVASVVRSPVDRAVRSMTERGDTCDLVVLDPPRSGAGAAVVRDVARMNPRAIAYVACDPAALARDLATFNEVGYAVVWVRAYDAFPMTHHVECVALLHRERESPGSQATLTRQACAGTQD